MITSTSSPFITNNDNESGFIEKELTVIDDGLVSSYNNEMKSDIMKELKKIVKEIDNDQWMYDSSSPMLYTKGVVLGYRRSKVSQYNNISLVKIEGVVTRKDTRYYLGKKVAIARRVKQTEKNPKGVKIVWGKICKPHGNSGAVQARFSKNLPPKAMGAKLRVMMFPSAI
ncbi:S60 ribosomal protein L35a [Cavenderia fasciculata]|uniref:S60 ribosomal protein L35a n=1 Tax=Cavenderia fasciculata TaxID=261658 RepID=F4PRZ9_CACFS|nr:S60 ribosomal protein L35a [Cavenderia fasciculata]EGG20597.1 S60 ribosomal protein L35a [Cavenderia fasciculata]|eukprot:XP_004358447.1 S60 ribosomal protein L35a [Cavenderia fasciculata]